ncbi:hypothetical protein F4780DRAFT_403888 [Xylariomycetidae sp. FL0641]|nr:hypothetical protein F4780DRAFT_403888 [Xylariomycetidae sp. FL0641]
MQPPAANMKRRGSKRARLFGRSKSTRSTQRTPASGMLSEESGQTAQTAAQRAFERGQGRTAQNTRPPPLPLSPSTLRLGMARQVPPSPNATPPRLGKNASGDGMVSAAKGIAGDYISGLISDEEQHTAEDGIASVPSSYRRLRRSQSVNSHLRPGKKEKAFKATDTVTEEPATVFRSRSLRQPRGVQEQSTEKAVTKGSLRRTARKVSNTLKERFKILISMNRDEENDSNFPLQQVNGRLSLHDNDGLEDDFSAVAPMVHMEEGSLQRVASAVPSLHKVPSKQRLCSRKGSMGNLNADPAQSDEKSRCTSWTDSEQATGESASSHEGDRGMHRLSKINEDGPHVSSSSKRPSDRSRPAATGTMNQQGEEIFSALMNRGTSEAKTMERKKSKRLFLKTQTPPVRSSSLNRAGTPVVQPPKPSGTLDEQPSSGWTSGRRLRDCKSEYFPGSGSYTPFRGQGHYREQVQHSMELALEDPNPWGGAASSLPHRQRSLAGMTTYSESIYSSDQMSQIALPNIESVFPIRSPPDTGVATIYQSVRRVGSLPQFQRGPTPMQSRPLPEWVADETNHRFNTRGFNCELSTGYTPRHVRENAQIEDEEDGLTSISGQSLQTDVFVDGNSYTKNAEATPRKSLTTSPPRESQSVRSSLGDISSNQKRSEVATPKASTPDMRPENTATAVSSPSMTSPFQRQFGNLGGREASS